MADSKISFSHVALTVLLLGCLAVIGFQIIDIKRLERSRMAFSPGENLPEMQLLSMDNTPFESGELAQGVTVLFCFKTPCSACNSNLKLWNNIAKFFEGRIKVLGIIPDGNPEAFTLADEKKALFPLYVPVDKNAFSERMRLKLNVARTIVVDKNTVRSVTFGDLSAEDLQSVIHTIKELISKPKET